MATTAGLDIPFRNPIAGKTGTKTNLMVGSWEWFQSVTGVWVGWRTVLPVSRALPTDKERLLHYQFGDIS
jgi:hypothetical protein